MKYIALHHTGTKGRTQIYAVNRYHKKRWGKKSSLGWYVGYNFFVEKDGTQTQTRDIYEESVAQIGHNCDIEERCDTISYCMAGDFRDEDPTNAQKQDFREFITEWRERFPDIEVVGHRELQKNRTCPELPPYYINSFNDMDNEDDKKRREIQQCRSIIDNLIALIAKLLHGKKK